MATCLHGDRYAEQLEGAALNLGGGGEDSSEAIPTKADDIACQCGEISEQGVEAVHWQLLASDGIGAFAGSLVPCRRRGLGLLHRRAALCLACRRIVLVEQHRRQA